MPGTGDYRAELEQLASQPRPRRAVVTFHGFVSEERKIDLMRSAWANIFPSPKEGWGITVIEAAACGTPSLASDSPGLRDSVCHGETGFLVPHGDVDAWPHGWWSWPTRRRWSDVWEIVPAGSPKG